MKLWEKIFIGIGAIIIIFIIITLRKVMIFTNLDYLNKEQQKSGNIYCKVTNGQRVTEIYTKGDVQKMVVKDNNRVIIQISNLEYRILYNITNKTVSKYKRSDIPNPNKISNYAYYSTLPEKILNSISSKITTEKIDGQEYYVISGHNTYLINNENVKDKVYIDKNTGLTYKHIATIKENGNLRDQVDMFEYKFNVVTDEDVAELDSSEYKIEN